MGIPSYQQLVIKLEPTVGLHVNCTNLVGSSNIGFAKQLYVLAAHAQKSANLVEDTMNCYTHEQASNEGLSKKISSVYHRQRSFELPQRLASTGRQVTAFMSFEHMAHIL